MLALDDLTWLPPAQINPPRLAGSYILKLLLPATIGLQVGRLGYFCLAAGTYVYCGSAHGPGGLAGRIQHHTRPVRKPHWHIDYLRQAARLQSLAWQTGSLPLECAWSREFSALIGASIPIPGFGASDCRQGCPAHLVYLG